MSYHINKEAVIIKVIVLGSANVGKTALMERYCSLKFSDSRIPTIGTDFRTKVLEIHDTEVILQVWDTAGQERFHHGTLGNAFYRGANGAMLVYDIMNPRSIQQLAQWRDEAVSKIDADVYFPIVVIGNKVDLRMDKGSLTKQSSPTNSRKNATVLRANNVSSLNQEEDLDVANDATWVESPSSGKTSSETVKSHESLSIGDDQDDTDCKDCQQTVLQWCRNNSYGHLETSAKDDIGIQAAMQTIAALALEAYKTNPKNGANSKKASQHSGKINLKELYAPKSKSACDSCAS